MDEATIQQIAAEVVARLPFGDHYWLVFVVNAVVAALIGALAVLGTSYLRTRGQNLATKHDFDELQKQLKANTELVETIRSEVGQKDWSKREWTNLRRTKLEALLEKMHDCDAYLNVLWHKSFSGEQVLQERDPFNELNTIATHLPELEQYVYDFVKEGRTQAIRALKLGRTQISNNEEVIRQGRDEYYTWWQDNAAKLIQASHALREAARRLLVEVMDVEEEP